MAERGMSLFVTGQALSILGDTAMWLAAEVWVKQLTGSNGAAGMVYFALMIGLLFAPAAGIVVDKVRRRPLLIVTNASMCAIVLALITLLGGHTVALLPAGVAGAFGKGPPWASHYWFSPEAHCC